MPRSSRKRWASWDSSTSSALTLRSRRPHQFSPSRLASLASGPELQRPQLVFTPLHCYVGRDSITKTDGSGCRCLRPTAVRSIDVTAMKKLSDVANVAPVIPKSDPLTMDERTGFKQPLVRSRSPPLRSMPHHNAPCRVERTVNCKDV
ncbi:hypothetical protein A4X06_0g9498 [Tilletia controversa]|uniref:Septin-type G domain-containing protein n=1 Tax=Tilletia controversa TaxID=13291 RepID=A0A8X7SS69_9BASI|nr:hypothetical protein CF328_g5777 [Tilletia controversa]KAE8236601.1 hypothetical protein A4X06_0g9498 [Tilletia controversa]